MYCTINLTRIHVLALLIPVMVFIGCDSDNGSASERAFTFEGRVTDDAGFGKRANVEGAVVTAANLESSGSLTTLAGETTTDADGGFSLEVDGATDVVVLKAEKETFASEVLVLHKLEAGGTIRTMPMTVESEAEAAVYVESARNGSAGEGLTAADVAAYVNKGLAAEWKAGSTTATQIVAALEASAQAEADFFEEAEDADVDSDELRQQELSSFLTLQAGLNGASTASAQTEAMSTFEQALIAAYTEAGASLEAQAKARQTARAALVKFYSQAGTQARFALRQQAEILTSLATCRAIEAAFEADGASETRLNSLVQARTNLIAALRAASSVDAMANAHATYEADVEVELMAELNISTAVLALVETALTTAKAALDASVAGAASARAVATAYTTFYTTAETSAQTTLATTSNAELGAGVLALLSAQ